MSKISGGGGGIALTGAVTGATSQSQTFTNGVSVGAASLTDGTISFFDSADLVPLVLKVTGSGSFPSRTLTLNWQFLTGDRTLSLPDASGTLLLDGATQTSPIINTATLNSPTINGESIAFSAKTSNYTLLTTDDAITVDATSGNVTITLPAASSVPGKLYRVKRIDASGNTVTIARAGSDTIDGATSVSLTAQYQAKTLLRQTSTTWGVY